MSSANVTVGGIVPDFCLKNQDKADVTLSKLTSQGAVLIVFYPGDFTPVCTKQLCNYQDNIESFKRYGLNIVGISANSPDDHKRFKDKYNFGFDLLTDPKKEIAKQYGCTSLLMFGGISRAVLVIGKNKELLYRYVEPTILSRRKANELVEIIDKLKKESKL